MASRSWLRWAPYWAICSITALLFVIAVMIVLSLIPIYLSAEGRDINLASGSSSTRNIDMQFSTNTVFDKAQSITNLEYIGRVLNEMLGYPADTLSVKAGSVNNQSRKKKKRQTATPVCGKANNMGLSIFISKCPDSKCKSDHCFDKCASNIKIRIQSKLGSTAFSIVIQVAGGTSTTVSAVFCSFQQITSSATSSTIMTANSTLFITTTTTLTPCANSAVCTVGGLSCSAHCASLSRTCSGVTNSSATCPFSGLPVTTTTTDTTTTGTGTTTTTDTTTTGTSTTTAAVTSSLCDSPSTLTCCCY